MFTDDNIIVRYDKLYINDISCRCTFGKNGYTKDKLEGDGKTPLGDFGLGRVFFRPDKQKKIETKLDIVEITPDMGWANDVNDPKNYNKLITFPYPYSAEKLYRDDNWYDILIVIEYNTDPTVIGKGSAIFFHLASEDYVKTEGCIAVSLEDMCRIIKILNKDNCINIHSK